MNCVFSGMNWMIKLRIRWETIDRAVEPPEGRHDGPFNRHSFTNQICQFIRLRAQFITITLSFGGNLYDLYVVISLNL
ncbi:MAG: hypothetical protein E6H10_03555 [Bacteroidetes bacterium]|nr:MAG: hypothetical protein E6H10_03555 [Bacteroidota bacterium]